MHEDGSPGSAGILVVLVVGVLVSWWLVSWSLSDRVTRKPSYRDTRLPGNQETKLPHNIDTGGER